MNLPLPFMDQMKRMLGNSFTDFESSLMTKASVSVRINPLKPENELNLSEKIKWCNNAYYLDERPKFTFDPYFHAGHYYVQESSSMFLDFILHKINLNKSAKVLDLCSAPGGKATLLLAYLSQNAFLHCHEYEPLRANILRQNLERWGSSNTLITQGPLAKLEQLNMQYDLILIDAPCSGEGMFRKEPDAILQWSQNKINNCTYMQKNILKLADQLCAEDGYIIYSTCTFNEQENEMIVKPYVDNSSYQSVEIENDFTSWSQNSTINTYRFYPHLSKGEGFTVSILKKQSESYHNDYNPKFKSRTSKEFIGTLNDWIKDPLDYSIVDLNGNMFAFSKDWLDTIEMVKQSTAIYYIGIPIGHYKGKDFYPNHGLSLSLHLNRNIERLEYNKDEAIRYLSSITPEHTVSTNSKWIVAGYRAANLGWLKSTGIGLKNYLPKNQRILTYYR